MAQNEDGVYVDDNGRWMHNPYYSPELCGLTLVSSEDLDNKPYQFHIVAVWKDNRTGKLYTAEDSGCSCPTPFEDYHSLADMTEIRG